MPACKRCHHHVPSDTQDAHITACPVAVITEIATPDAAVLGVLYASLVLCHDKRNGQYSVHRKMSDGETMWGSYHETMAEASENMTGRS